MHLGKCAYCGQRDATTMDHAIPRALYPESKSTSKFQRITVPACQPCNKSWMDDEPHFRNILLMAGEHTPVVDELWHGKTLRSFSQPDGMRRRRDVAAQLVAVQMAEGERHKVYPANDPRFMRVLRKVIRGLSHHHGVLTAVSDEQLWADVQRFQVPEDFLAEMTSAHAEADILQYRWAVWPSDEHIHSWWLLNFFGRTPFIGVVFRSVEARIASRGTQE